LGGGESQKRIDKPVVTNVEQLRKDGQGKPDEPAETITTTAPQTPSGPTDGTLGERLARLEGVVEGLRDSVEGVRHGQNLFMALAGIGMALIIAVVGYAITRIDNLPADFERMNQTLSQAITASKQQPPQVILVPAPASPGAPPKSR
jgi:hypothetical protein